MENGKSFELDLMGYVYRIVKRWRSIVIVAAVLALLVAGLGFVKGLGSLRTAEDPFEQDKEALETYNAHGKTLTGAIQDLQNTILNQETYNDESLLMRIDPMNVWIGTITFYVDSDYKINPGLSYQNTDITDQLLTAYLSYINNGGMCEQIAEQSSVTGDSRYLHEVITAEADNAALTVQCMAPSEAEVRQLVKLIKDQVNSQYPEFVEFIGNHKLDVLTESVYSMVDMTLFETQQENRESVVKNIETLEKYKTDLASWKQEGETVAAPGMRDVAKKAIRNLILCGVLGVFLMAVYYAVWLLLSKKTQFPEDWSNQGIRIVGALPGAADGRPGRKLDRWLARHVGGVRDEADTQHACRVLAGQLDAVIGQSQGSKAAVIGDPQDSAAVVSALQQMSDKLVFVGDVLTDANAVKQLEEYSTVYLLGEIGKTYRGDIKRQKQLLSAMGKTLGGAIVVG